MKRSPFYFVSWLILLIFFAPTTVFAQSGERSAMDVITRTLGYTPKNVTMKIVQQDKTALDYFTTEVSEGVLKITATSPTGACRAFYDYVTTNHYGVSTWSVNNIKLPKKLSDAPKKRMDCNV